LEPFVTLSGFKLKIKTLFGSPFIGALDNQGTQKGTQKVP